MRQGHGKKNQTGSSVRKNQTNVGRVSQYTSPLRKDISLFSQAIGAKATGTIFL